MSDLPTRVAVLEQIAKDTCDAIADLRTEIRQGFGDLRAEMRGMRTETSQGFTDIRAEMRSIRSEAATNSRWLISLMLGTSGALPAVMAHGFHWL